MKDGTNEKFHSPILRVYLLRYVVGLSSKATSKYLFSLKKKQRTQNVHLRIVVDVDVTSTFFHVVLSKFTIH